MIKKLPGELYHYIMENCVYYSDESRRERINLPIIKALLVHYPNRSVTWVRTPNDYGSRWTAWDIGPLATMKKYRGRRYFTHNNRVYLTTDFADLSRAVRQRITRKLSALPWWKGGVS